MTPTILKGLLVLIGLWALVSPIPNRRVHDFAGIIPAALSNELEQLLTAVERETSAEFAVVTVASLQNVDIDFFARKLFNQWGIGKAGNNNGVLFLIAPNERRARIEVGYGLEPLITDGLAGEILDTEVIPHFKEGDYSLGIRSGAVAVVTVLRKHPEAARGVPGSTPSYVLTPRRSMLVVGIVVGVLATVFLVIGVWCSYRERFPPVLFFVSIATIGAAIGVLLLSATQLSWNSIPLPSSIGGLGAAAVALLFNIRRFFRYRPHHCKACRTEMQLLSEVADDKKLSEQERLEEKLGSVDYDVWVCPACLKEHTEEYVAFLSSFSKCGACTRRTYSEESTVLRSATEYSTGTRRIDGECKNCWHTTTRTETIPRITRSSGSSSGGSSGGSFGGGSSGGGGASRGW